MFIKKVGGNHYVFSKGRGKIRNVFIPRHCGERSNLYVGGSVIHCDPELIGKRLRLRVEEVRE